jgi:hypothetical protein
MGPGAHTEEISHTQKVMTATVLIDIGCSEAIYPNRVLLFRQDSVQTSDNPGKFMDVVAIWDFLKTNWLAQPRHKLSIIGKCQLVGSGTASYHQVLGNYRSQTWRNR